MNNDQTPENKISSNKDFNVEMYRNENDVTKKFNNKILIGIIVALALVIIVLIFIKARPCTVTNQADLDKYQDQVKFLEEERLSLATDLYTMAKDVVGDMYLNTELICGPFVYEYDKKGEIINAEFYKSGNSKFSTYQALVSYVKARFSYGLSNTLLNVNTFKSVDGLLYCAKASRTANNRYVGLDSITFESDQDNILSFVVKEKYLNDSEDLACLNDCDYVYRENYFTLEYTNNHYLVKDFTLPY